MTGPKRVTPKQLAANRRNAQRSTGPRTPRGKAVSRWNALTHGILAQAIIPPPLDQYESRQDFDRLLARLRDEFDPASAMEELLVERIATAYWRLGRVLRAEGAAIAQRRNTIGERWGQPGSFHSTSWPRSAPSVEEQAQALSAALDDLPELRRIMLQAEPDLRDADDKRLLAAARARLAHLQHELTEQANRNYAVTRARSSVPSLAEALQLSRYETTLEHQIYRALYALERLQGWGGADPVAPPLRLAADSAADAASLGSPSAPDHT